MSGKESYTIPEFEIITLKVADIIATSPNENEWNDENVQEEGWLCTERRRNEY